MEFKNEIGRLQRLVSASSAGISRRQAVLESLVIKTNDHIIDVGCGAGDLLIHLAKAVDNDGHIYGLDPSEDQINNANVKCAEFKNILPVKLSMPFVLTVKFPKFKELLRNKSGCPAVAFLNFAVPSIVKSRGLVTVLIPILPSV